MAKGRNNSSNEARQRGGVTRRSAGGQGQSTTSDRGRRIERSTAHDVGRSSRTRNASKKSGAGGSRSSSRSRSASSGRGGSKR